MNLHTLPRHLRLVLRGEILTLQAKFAFGLRRALVAALALLFVGLGIVFVNMALFAYLTPLWGPVWTPAGLGLINLGLAGAALLLAAGMKPGADLALAEEIRSMAGEQLEADLRAGPAGGSMMGGLERSALNGLLVPAITSIVGALARRRKEKA
jgi:hypothetical protein